MDERDPSSLLAFPPYNTTHICFLVPKSCLHFCQVTVEREKETKAMAWCEFVLFFKKKFLSSGIWYRAYCTFLLFYYSLCLRGRGYIRTHARTAHRHASPQEGGGEKGLSSLHFFFRGSFSSYFLFLLLLLSPVYIYTPPFSPHNPNP